MIVPKQFGPKIPDRAGEVFALLLVGLLTLFSVFVAGAQIYFARPVLEFAPLFALIALYGLVSITAWYLLRRRRTNKEKQRDEYFERLRKGLEE